MSAEDVEGAIETAYAEPTPEGDEMLPLLWERLGERIGLDAVARAENLPRHLRQHPTTTRALTGWARTDPAAIWTWATSPGADGTANPQLGRVIGLLIQENHFDFVLARFSESEDVRIRQSIASSAAADVGRYAPQLLLEMAASLPQGEPRFRLIQVYATRLAWRDSGTAPAEWALTLDAADRVRAINSVLGVWRQSDRSGQITQWLLAQEPADHLDGFISGHVSLQAEPPEASQLVDRILSNQVHDEAVQRLAKNHLRRAPETAFAWAARIRNPHLRGSFLAELINDWKWRDREAARNFIVTSPLLNTAERGLLLWHLMRTPEPER